MSRSLKLVRALQPAHPAVIAAPAISQPRGLRAVDSTLVAMNVEDSEVKTSRDQIFGFVNSK
jgi:hypothetical protein